MTPALDALDDAAPHARLLSNGRYTVLLTGAGAGVSSWDGLQLTAWGGDRTVDGDGVFVYLRDIDSGDVWSAGHQPVGRAAERYAARYACGVVTIERSDDGIESAMEVCVAPDADVEVRRIRVSNRSARPRRIALTAYAEVVLNDPGAHASHPGFSKLFVQTEEADGVLLARRRPRSRTDRVPWMAASLRGDGSLEHETDRARFLGRGHAAALPAAVATSAALSGTTGSVLDPVFALRRTLHLAPGASAEVVLLLGAAETRAAALALIGCDVGAAFAGAVVAERELCERLGLTVEQGEELQELAGAVAYGAPGVVATDRERTQEYWRAKSFPLELPAATPPPSPPPARTPARFRPDDAGDAGRPAAASETLRFDNGHGGFSADGREYVIRVDAVGRPPMPWVNVIGNEHFGGFVSESGAAYTWSRNSREHRLTPWWNDPIADPYGEALWIRDDAAGVFWSPQPGPTPPAARFEVRHGFGVSRWRHTSHDLAQEVALFVARHDPVRIVRLRLTNTSARSRSLQVFSYAQLVLGVFNADARAVETEIDSGSATLYARNPRAGDFADGVAFAAGVTSGGAASLTADRTAFLGRNGSTTRPAAVAGASALDGRAGTGLDPCAAIQLPLTLPPGATVECAFLLGETADRAAAAALVARYRQPGAVERALAEVEAFWRDTLTAVQVETPSPGLDVMVNGWLGYQNVSCRLWGRTAFYQSGGAFGFRDQLQDSAALVYARPDLTRAQIVLHAGHQFVEGDVLHWWHPPADRGTRTRFSDDLVWLPYVTAFYVRTTGDWSVLDESAPFLTARVLEPGEDEAYLQASASAESADVYSHCCRALDRALTRGAHGLPLMGTGDWNDGMNRVGREGRGESVWLGFFISFVLREFLPLCERRGDDARAQRYREYRDRLHDALETAGWDGDWYRRAYYDDGTPLGTASGDECRIDAIAQAWSVISGAAPPDRAARAIDAVERQLVDERAGIIRLLAPPFDKTPHDPGYIKGYVPGIRENGGQYTHGALWVIRALAELGRRDRAAHLLEMLGPVHHARSRHAVATYQVEPYVVAADVYGVPPHVGRGGWTWYTGSAGWMYRVALESVLGITIEDGTTLRIAPRVPDAWPSFRVRLRRPNDTTYDVEVENPRGDASGVASAEADGRPVPVSDAGARVPLATDGAVHRVRVVLGAG